MLASAFSAFLSCMNVLGLVVAIFLLIFPVLFFVGWSKTGRMPEFLPALGAFILGRIAFVLAGVLILVALFLVLVPLAYFDLLAPPENVRASASSSVGILWGVAMGAMVLGMFHLFLGARAAGWIYNLVCKRDDGYEVAMLEFGVPFGILMVLMFMGLMTVTITGVPPQPQEPHVASSSSSGAYPGGPPGNAGTPFPGASPAGPGGNVSSNSGSGFSGAPGGGISGGPGSGIPGGGPDGAMPGGPRGSGFPGAPGGGIPGGPGSGIPSGGPDGAMPGGPRGSGFPGAPGGGIPGGPGSGIPSGGPDGAVPGGPRGSGFPGLPGGGIPGGPGSGIPGGGPDGAMPGGPRGSGFPGLPGGGIPGGPGSGIPGGGPGGTMPGGPRGSGFPGLPGGGIPGGPGIGLPGSAGNHNPSSSNAQVPPTLLGKAGYLLRQGKASAAWDHAWAAYLLEEEPQLENAVKWCNALNRPVLGMPRVGVVVVNRAGLRLTGVGNQAGSPLGPLATALPEVSLALADVAKQLGSPSDTPWLVFLGSSSGGSHLNALARLHRVDLIVSVLLVRKRRGRRYDLQLQFQLHQPGKPQPVWKSQSITSSQYRSAKSRGTDLLQQMGQQLLAELRRRYPLSNRPTLSNDEAAAYLQRVLNSLDISAIEKAALVKYLARHDVLSPEQAAKAAQQVTIRQMDVTKPNPELEQWVQSRLPPVN